MSNIIISTTKFGALFACILVVFTACDSGDDAPSGSTKVIISADLPSDVIRLINEQQIIKVELLNDDKTQAMNILIDNTAELSINNYNLSTIAFQVIITVDIQGQSVILAQASQNETIQVGPENTFSVNLYQYPDEDNDSFSNLLEIVNNTDYQDPNVFPTNTVNGASAKVMSSSNYAISNARISDLNYSPVATSYDIQKSSSTIYDNNGTSRTIRQVQGKPLYEINTNN